MRDPAQHRAGYLRNEGELKEEVAKLIGVEARDLALTDNTSRGNNLAVQMIDAPRGSNVVVDATTYPSQLGPWLLPGKEHVEVRRVRSRGQCPEVEEFERLVDGNTVAVSVSHVCRLTGFRHDLAELGKLTRAAGAYLLVDGAQSVGAVTMKAREWGVDFLSFGSMKWLLGPPGIGFFYVRRDLQDRLAPPHVGPVGASVTWAGQEASLQLAGDGARHELSSTHYAGIEAALAGVKLLTMVPIEEIEVHVVGLAQRLIDGLLALGVEVRTPSERGRHAGVVAFTSERPDGLRTYLRDRQVDIWGYEAQRRMRADPHIYNTVADVDRLIRGIEEFS